MTEEKLVSILREEETDASSYYDSELAAKQAEAMDRFYARPFGNEIEGRSQVVTHDVEDTINWIMPKLMRAFMQADELISVEDPASDDTYNAKCAADYLRHVFFKDNPGEENIYDFTFDGLLQKVGWIRVAWEDPKPKPPRVLEGVGPEQLQRYVDDPEYEILEGDVQDVDQMGTPSVFSLKVRHTPRMGRVCVECIPPEEMAFSRRAKSGGCVDYKRWKREVFLADLVREYPDKAEQLRDPGTGTGHADSEVHDAASDSRKDARFFDEPANMFKTGSEVDGRRKVYLIQEEIRIDFDGDGITELRHVKRVGNTLLENVEIEHSEFYSWTPIRVSHRLAGRSLTDTMLDLQRIRTVILRNTLDSMSQSLVPRTALNMQMADEETVATLLDAEIGGVVKVQGNVGEAIQPLVTPDLSAQGLAMLEYMDQRSEEATGVTRHAQGLKSEAITDTKGGIEALQGAANERIELIARWVAKGLGDVFKAILHLIVAHQDQPRIIKVNGKPMSADPRTWSDEMSVDVSIGMATENRMTRLANLNLIAAKQEQILLQAGPTNPMVGLPEYRTTLAMITEQMGMRAPERFFKELDQNYQPPEPGPDPKVAEAQMKAQLEQQKAQTQAQLDAARMQMDQQIAAQKLENERQLALIKAQSEQQIAQIRIASEAQIARERMMMERELAREKQAMDAELAERDSQRRAQAGIEAANLKAQRPGGNLAS